MTGRDSILNTFLYYSYTVAAHEAIKWGKRPPVVLVISVVLTCFTAEMLGNRHRPVSPFLTGLFVIGTLQFVLKQFLFRLFLIAIFVLS